MIPNAPDFSNMVPGFDFLQGLVKNAGSVLPGVGQWVAPTLDPAELEKRIDELRTVQFWLEQNGRMIGATIQALEVQRMTLSTLQTMNVQVADLREAMRIKLPEAKAREPAVAEQEPAAPAEQTTPNAPSAPPAGVVDPTQWWSALTKQFTELAATAIKDASAVSATEAARRAARHSPTQKSAAESGSGKAARAAPEKTARKAAKKAAGRSTTAAVPRGRG